MLRAWLELGPGYIGVSLAAPQLADLMDMIPLMSVSAPPHPDIWANVTIYSLPGQCPQVPSSEAPTDDCRQITIPNNLQWGPDATVWLCDGRVLIHLPGHGYATCMADWSSSDVYVGTDSKVNSGLVVGAVVQAIAAQHGFFGTHASTVERDGRGVMFCGAPAQGKSSCCLALGRAGWTVRADDRCYLHRDGTGVLAWGPGGEMRLRPDAPKLWSDVAEIMQRGIPWGAKTRVLLDDVVPQSGPGAVRPAVLLFPHIGGQQHRVEPLAPELALPQLLRVSGLSPLPMHAARHFELTADLIEATPCYRLHLGPDMSLLPAFIAELFG